MSAAGPPSDRRAAPRSQGPLWGQRASRGSGRSPSGARPPGGARREAPVGGGQTNTRGTLSLEFFPPRTPEGADKLRAARRQLAPLRPAFCSVTFGAGGSTREGTLATVLEIRAEGLPAAPHISCIGSTRESIRAVLAQYREHGIRGSGDGISSKHN